MVRLHAYWTEVCQFLEQVASVSKVDAVISALDKQEASASMREQVLQESTAAFSQRLDSAYGEFADISMPIQLALLQLRLGLRLIADANAVSENAFAEDQLVAHAVVSFPSIAGLKVLADVSHHQSSNTSFSLTLWRLSGLALEVASGVELSSSMSHVEVMYEQSLRLWMIDKARREEAERQEQSLYRHKTEHNGPATEAELEEQEFLALFPEYVDLLEEPGTTSDPEASRRSADLVNPSDVKRLSNIHHSLFGTGATSVIVSSSPGDELARLRKAIIRDILVTQASHHSEVLDQHSKPYQIFLLLGQNGKLQGVAEALPSNFYADPNVPEIRKSSEVLRCMVARLSALIEEWPEQMVLQHLKSRCEAILQLDIFSPVAKVLSAIEQLLLQMEDWEMYANRENTLKSYQHELASLVVSWRRLELTSWQGLLRAQAQDFAEGASEWWFRLYEATVRGVAAASQEEEYNADAVGVYLESLVPLLDSFMTSSPLGQFSARLQHLRAFEVYCLQLGQRSPSFRRVHRILHSTRLYYAQFLPRVTASLNSQQQALEKEIRDFIKLASWKDINVHALKQSAQRTHRQLYKCVRKFREILRQPVTPHLVPTQAVTEESSSTPTLSVLRLSEEETSPLPPFTVSPSHPHHLQHLDRTFKNFGALIQGRVGDIIGSLASTDLEDLSAEIIATLQSLASATAPAKASKEQREKFHKALLVRKRKAWSDLLKELKRVGLAVNVKPEVLEQQSNPRWLREQPLLVEQTSDLGPFDKSEVYFLRLTKLLPDLRTTLGSHHPDIGTRDLQRGTNLVESAFSFAVDARAWYVSCESIEASALIVWSVALKLCRSCGAVSSSTGFSVSPSQDRCRTPSCGLRARRASSRHQHQGGPRTARPCLRRDSHDLAAVPEGVPGDGFPS